MDGWSDYVRIVNLIFSVVVLIWLIARRVKDWKAYGEPGRNDAWLIATYWTGALLVGTIEQLFDTGTDSRVVLYFFALLVTARYLWRYNNSRHSQRNGGWHANKSSPPQ